MNEESVEGVVMDTIALVCDFERDAITPEARVADFGMDSLTMTSFASQIEAIFECDIGVDEMSDLMQAPLVSDVVALVQNFCARQKTR